MIKLDLGETYRSHFPQYEADYVTPRTGLSGFTATVWEGNVASAVLATVAEIGTSGEYAVTFTPTHEGLWSVEVYSPATGDHWGDELTVTQAELAWGLSAADDGASAHFAIWLERDGERQVDFESVTAVIRLPDGTDVADLGEDTADTGDGVFGFTAPSAGLTPGQEYYLACAATRAGLTWYNNLGFSRV